MSSEYDIVHISPNLTLPDWGLSKEPEEVEFQSKSLPEAFCLRNVYVTNDGLYIEDFNLDEVPLKERPAIRDANYDNPEEEAEPLEKFFGSLEKIDNEIVKSNYTGAFTFYTSPSDYWYKYEAEVEEGNIKSISKVE